MPSPHLAPRHDGGGRPLHAARLQPAPAQIRPTRCCCCCLLLLDSTGNIKACPCVVAHRHDVPVRRRSLRYRYMRLFMAFCPLFETVQDPKPGLRRVPRLKTQNSHLQTAPAAPRLNKLKTHFPVPVQAQDSRLTSQYRPKTQNSRLVSGAETDACVSWCVWRRRAHSVATGWRAWPRVRVTRPARFATASGGGAATSPACTSRSRSVVF